MKDLLFLCHRLPYPPNKGDKIRSYHILKHLTKTWRVHLVSFIDDENDEQYVSDVSALCSSVHIKRLHPLRAKVKALLGLLFGRSFSDAFYDYASVRREVNRLIKHHAIATAFCYSTPMAQYIDDYPAMIRCMDFVDMDSYKWKQYAGTYRAPMKWIFATEFNRLLSREKSVALTFNRCWFVTPEERTLFLKESGVSPNAISYFSNGVDQAYFQPKEELTSPYPAQHKAIVFTGAMDYYANADAVAWFVENIFPLLQKVHPELYFYIVGSKPTDRVRALGKQPHVIVTGRVPDVRPYLQHASLAVAPMRIARGLQNKVLEALAMNKAIVCSQEAMEGLIDDARLHPLIARDVESFVEKCLAYVDSHHNWRSYVEQHYQWDRNLSVLSALERVSP